MIGHIFWKYDKLTFIIYDVLLTSEHRDQIGQFLKVLGNKFACKSSPKTLETFWAILKSITLS